MSDLLDEVDSLTDQDSADFVVQGFGGDPEFGEPGPTGQIEGLVESVESLVEDSDSIFSG